MFASLTSFLLVGLQWGLFAWLYFKGSAQTFDILFTHLSPVLVFFGLIDSAMNGFTPISPYIWFGLIISVIKYFFLARALVVEPLTFFNVVPALAEAAYIGLSALFIISNNYIH